MTCEATFKEHCQWPRCDCKRHAKCVPVKAKIKFNGGRGALLCEWCDVIIKEDFDPLTIEDKYHYCGGDYCKIQDNCKHGWVFPDRCRYNNRLGCDCGAYPGE